jgi:hypothetical protein
MVFSDTEAYLHDDQTRNAVLSCGQHGPYDFGNMYLESVVGILLKLARASYMWREKNDSSALYIYYIACSDD